MTAISFTSKIRPSVGVSVAIMALLILAAIIVHAQGLRELVTEISIREEYSHAYFIPLVSLWLIWARRDALLRCPLKPTWLAAIPLAICLLLLAVTKATNAAFFEQVGFAFCLAAIVLAVGGWRMFQLSAVPLVYLMFAIPMPAFLTTKLTIGLQLLSSELGVFFIRLFHIPVYLEGNVIDLGEYQLGVVEACSGLTYMIPFLGVSFLLAFLVKLGWIERGIIFLSAIPIAILMNGVRIGFIGLIVDRFGIDHVEGFIHYFEGWVVFVLCLVLLLLVVMFLCALHRTSFMKVFGVPAVPEGLVGFVPSTAENWKSGPAIGLGALLIVTAVAVYASPAGLSIVPDRKMFVSLPSEIDGYNYIRSYDLGDAVEEVLAADDYIVADFAGEDGRDFNLYIHYFNEKKGRKGWHSPSGCMPGGGWKITDHDIIDVPDHQNRSISLNRLFIERGRVRQVVYYWYQQRGRRIAGEWALRYYLILDGLNQKRSDGAMIRLITTLKGPDDKGPSEARLQQFVKAVTRPMPAYVPD